MATAPAPPQISDAASGGGYGIIGPAPPQVSDAASGGGYAPAAHLPVVPPGGGVTHPAGGSTSPGGVSVNSITGVRDYSTLSRLAQDQVNAEIGGQEAPLSGELSMLQNRETNAQGALTTMYGSLMPYVQGEATMVNDSYERAQQAQQAIFSTANAKMNQQLQDRAQQAQALAQEMGGPVAIAEFNGNLGSYAEALSQTGAADQLHALGNAQAGVQEAADFAGKVFPLSQAEHHQEISNFFEGEQQKIRDQITTLEGTKAGKVNSTLNDMLKTEREYALQKTQQAQDKVKADRDFKTQQHTLANDDERLRLARDQFGLQSKQTTAQIKATQQSIDLRKLQITTQAQLASQRLGISAAQLNERVRHSIETESIAKQRVQVQQQHNALQVVGALTGNNNKPVTLTVRAKMDPTAAAIAIAKGDKNVHSDGKGGYYTYRKATQTPQQWKKDHGIDVGTPVGDMNAVYQQLIAAKFTPATALAAIRAKTGNKTWKPK